MWNVKAEVITVVTGATGTISKSVKTVPEHHTGNHEIKKLQKPAILGTAHILRGGLT